MFSRLGLLFVALALVGCKHGVDIATATQKLSGRWILNTEHNCTYGEVKSDELILHPDGTFDQHLLLTNGQTYNSTANRWSFFPSRNLALESRWNYPAGSTAPIRESESLIVEFTEPPSILIHPDNNCFYSKLSK